MGKDSRLDIYLSSHLIFAKRGEYIIKQGSYGNVMYVILQGCVDVKVELKFEKATKRIVRKDTKVYMKQLATLFDGDRFGEMALIDLEKKEDIS
jgi:CRP-like cAMP-binding protein